MYNITALCMFGIPHSLSRTFYSFQEKKTWYKVFFPSMMISVAFLLVFSWLHITNGNDLQFLAFLSSIGLMFTGAAPSFMRSKLENNVHTGSAIFSVICALLWVIFAAKLFYVLIICFMIILLIALVTNTLIKAWTYWLETASIITTFISIILYYFNNL